MNDNTDTVQSIPEIVLGWMPRSRYWYTWEFLCLKAQEQQLSPELLRAALDVLTADRTLIYGGRAGHVSFKGLNLINAQESWRRAEELKELT